MAHSGDIGEQSFHWLAAVSNPGYHGLRSLWKDCGTWLFFVKFLASSIYCLHSKSPSRSSSHSLLYLPVGITSAGIAGLSAGIALRRAGHEIDNFEKSFFTQEIGAAITLTLNGNHILDELGFDFENVRETDKFLHPGLTVAR